MQYKLMPSHCHLSFRLLTFVSIHALHVTLRLHGGLGLQTQRAPLNSIYNASEALP